MREAIGNAEDTPKSTSEVQHFESLHVAARAVFEAFDADSNGVLDAKEADLLLKRLYSDCPANRPSPRQLRAVARHACPVSTYRVSD